MVGKTDRFVLRFASARTWSNRIDATRFSTACLGLRCCITLILIIGSERRAQSAFGGINKSALICRTSGSISYS